MLIISNYKFKKVNCHWTLSSIRKRRILHLTICRLSKKNLKNLKRKSLIMVLKNLTISDVMPITQHLNLLFNFQNFLGYFVHLTWQFGVMGRLVYYDTITAPFECNLWILTIENCLTLGEITKLFFIKLWF